MRIRFPAGFVVLIVRLRWSYSQVVVFPSGSVMVVRLPSKVYSYVVVRSASTHHHGAGCHVTGSVIREPGFRADRSDLSDSHITSLGRHELSIVSPELQNYKGVALIWINGIYLNLKNVYL